MITPEVRKPTWLSPRALYCECFQHFFPAFAVNLRTTTRRLCLVMPNCVEISRGEESFSEIDGRRHVDLTAKQRVVLIADTQQLEVEQGEEIESNIVSRVTAWLSG